MSFISWTSNFHLFYFFQFSYQDLKDHMRGLGGDVIRADVMTDQGGRSRGCGIVEFATSDQASQAIEQLNNTELKGRMIFVREVMGSQGYHLIRVLRRERCFVSKCCSQFDWSMNLH